MDNGEVPERKLTPLEQFDRTAGERVNTDRGEVYGHPIVDFRRACHMQVPIKECDDKVLAHPMMMIAVKIARLIETPDHLDSWIDIAGYARTAAMIIDKRQEPWDELDRQWSDEEKQKALSQEIEALKINMIKNAREATGIEDKWPGEDGGIDDPLGR